MHRSTYRSTSGSRAHVSTPAPLFPGPAAPQARDAAPFLPTTRAEMHALGWSQCDIIIVTGDAYVDHPSFGMAIIGRVLEARGFKVGIIAQPNWRDTQDFTALGEPRLFFGITAGNMDSMVNRYTSDRRVRSDDAYTPQGAGGRCPDRSVIVYAQRARRIATCRSSSGASKPRCDASRTSTTGRRRCAARCCWMPRPTFWSTATASARSARSRTAWPQGRRSVTSPTCAAPRSHDVPGLPAGSRSIQPTWMPPAP